MNHRLVAAIGRATKAVRANNLMDGMRLIQDALSQRRTDQVRHRVRTRDGTHQFGHPADRLKGDRSPSPCTLVNGHFNDGHPARSTRAFRSTATTSPRGAWNKPGFVRRHVSYTAGETGCWPAPNS